MSNAIVPTNQADMLERVLVSGDLSKLDSAQRVNYYRAVCESVGLNPLTKPFDYITLNNKLTLYAKRDAADQLRRLHGISIIRLDREIVSDIYVVTAYAQGKDGRTDSSIGAVSILGAKGDNLANAMMKAETKAKRRVTLSIAGLGWLDETEMETIPSARPVTVTEDGEIVEPAPASNGRKPAPPVEPEPVIEPAAGFEDILAMIDEFKTVTVGDVVSVIGHTGLYNAGPHVLNAIKLYPKFEGKAEPTPATKLTRPGAKALANWLIDRKREENAMQPVDVDAINGELFG
jgi:hypothetical protein